MPPVDKKLREAVGLRIRDCLIKDLRLTGKEATTVLGYPFMSGFMMISSGRTSAQPHAYKTLYDLGFDLNWVICGSSPKCRKSPLIKPVIKLRPRDDATVRKNVGRNLKEIFCQDYQRTEGQAAALLGYSGQSGFSSLSTGRNFPPLRVFCQLHAWNFNLNWVICNEGNKLRVPGKITQLIQSLGEDPELKVIRRQSM